MNKSTVDITLALLKKIPNSQKLLILLDRSNLVLLSELYGQNKYTINQELAAGKKPGEILLELLEKETNPEILFSKLPPVEQNKLRQKYPHLSHLKESIIPDSRSKHQLAAAHKKKQVFANKLFWPWPFIIISSLTVFIPPLILTGFMPNVIPWLTFETGLYIAIFGGGLAGSVSSIKENLSIKGLLIGIVYGISTFLATYYYTQGRIHLLKIELVIPYLLGSLPPILILWLSSKIHHE